MSWSMANGSGQCSSVGSLTKDLLTAMYNACQGQSPRTYHSLWDMGSALIRSACSGDSGILEYNSRNNRPKKGKGSAPLELGTSPFQRHFRVYFPSDETVQQSRGGPNVRHILSRAQLYEIDSSLTSDSLARERGLSVSSRVGGIRQHSHRVCYEMRETSGWGFSCTARCSLPAGVLRKVGRTWAAPTCLRVLGKWPSFFIK